MRFIYRLGFGTGIFLLAGSLASASTLTFNTTFTSDDDQALFNIVLNSTETVTLETTSAAGGGFPTVVSLFGPVTDDDPALQAYDDGPGPDSALTETLAAGSYLVVITEQDNTPTGGTNLLDPDLWVDPPGTGNFTAVPGVNPGPFVNQFDPFENYTGNLSVEFEGVDSASEVSGVPEAGTGVLTMGAVGVLAFLRRWRAR